LFIFLFVKTDLDKFPLPVVGSWGIELGFDRLVLTYEQAVREREPFPVTVITSCLLNQPDARMRQQMRRMPFPYN
jgi:aspartyl-tRNA synthetase